jgi:hypothetical protein
MAQRKEESAREKLTTHTSPAPSPASCSIHDVVMPLVGASPAAAIAWQLGAADPRDVPSKNLKVGKILQPLP